MGIKYDKKEWKMGIGTENFIIFFNRRKIRPLPKKVVFDLCEELLKQGYTPDFSELRNYEMIFKKIRR